MLLANNLIAYFVTDSGLPFLVDTGADISVIPPSVSEHKHHKDSFSLQEVNNTNSDIRYTTTHVQHWIMPQVSVHFIIAGVKTLILGADFLQHYSLLVDLKYNRLVDGIPQLRIQGISTHTSSPSPLLLPKQPKTEFDTILSAYPDIVQPCNTEAPVKHSWPNCPCLPS